MEGAREGILFYVNPKWETLAKASVWGDAASQIFYSFGLACGSLVAFASYSQVCLMKKKGIIKQSNEV